jgi:hypothetical protein
MTVASFFRKYSVDCVLNYVRLVITREICFIDKKRVKTKILKSTTG